MKFRKKVYLTIDDSPSENFIPKLNYLIKNEIPAIFFCIGHLLEKYPEAVIQGIRAGYPIENHSYSHPHFSDLTIEECKLEIEKTDKIIDRLYTEANVKRGQKLFRFPYGDKGDMRRGLVLKKGRKFNKERHERIQKILRDLDYAQAKYEGINYSFMNKAQLWEDADMSWTFDIMEWATFEKKPTLGIKNLQDVIHRLESKRPKDCRGNLWLEKRWLNSPSAEIILLHDHSETDDIFNTIIDKLKELPLDFELP